MIKMIELIILERPIADESAKTTSCPGIEITYLAKPNERELLTNPSLYPPPYKRNGRMFLFG